MAKISIKTDFKDGDKLFAVQLNNNFKTIQEAWDTANGIVWQGISSDFVMMFKGTTEEIEKRDIEDGQLLYNTETGETFLDTDNKRVNTGSGTVVAIQEEEPTNDATKLWINPDDGIQTIGTEVIDSMHGSEKVFAPSVDAVKKYVTNAIDEEHTYSTTEQIVGKWIDGKNIYRKVITTTEALNTNTVTINHNIENFEHVVRCYGYIPYGTSQYLFGAQEGSTYADIASVEPTAIKVKIGSNWLNSFTEGCVIIIEYTKTTDTVTN